MRGGEAWTDTSRFWHLRSPTGRDDLVSLGRAKSLRSRRPAGFTTSVVGTPIGNHRARAAAFAFRPPPPAAV